MSNITSFISKYSQPSQVKYPSIPSVKEFDDFIEILRVLITTDVESFRRNFNNNSLSSVYVYLRDSPKFMHEYLHMDFPSVGFLKELEKESVEDFEYMLRSSISAMVLVYLDRLYDDKNDVEKMQIYKNRVLSMQFLREFFRGSMDFDVMDHVLDDLEEFINLLLEDDEPFPDNGFVVEKGVLPRSTNLDGYTYRIIEESRVRNRAYNIRKEQERAVQKNKELESDVKSGTGVA